MIENDPQSQEPDGRQPRGKPDWFNRRVIATAVVTFMVVSLFGLVLTVIRHLGGQPQPIVVQQAHQCGPEETLSLAEAMSREGPGAVHSASRPP